MGTVGTVGTVITEGTLGTLGTVGTVEPARALMSRDEQGTYRLEGEITQYTLKYILPLISLSFIFIHLHFLY